MEVISTEFSCIWSLLLFTGGMGSPHLLKLLTSSLKMAEPRFFVLCFNTFLLSLPLYLHLTKSQPVLPSFFSSFFVFLEMKIESSAFTIIISIFSTAPFSFFQLSSLQLFLCFVSWQEWPKGSLEETVQNAIKSWEMELSHKTKLQDFKTIVPEKFKLFVNGKYISAWLLHTEISIYVR